MNKMRCSCESIRYGFICNEVIDVKALDMALYSTGINQSNYSRNISHKIKVYILHMYYMCITMYLLHM